MFEDFVSSVSLTGPLLIVGFIFSMLGLLFYRGGKKSWSKRHYTGTLVRHLVAIILLLTAFSSLLLTAATRGFTALTLEEAVITVETIPVGPQQFIAEITFPDSTKEQYEISGDELVIDAHVLKWNALANILGLHTAYELDRVTGRYRSIVDENTNKRTAYALGISRTVDIVSLTKKYKPLHRFVDAQYGSATFIPAGESAEWQILISTTGLMARRISDEPESNSNQIEETLRNFMNGFF